MLLQPEIGGISSHILDLSTPQASTPCGFLISINMSKKRKVNVYIDGFNFYHAICDNLCEEEWEKCKWINFRELSKNYIDKDTQKISAVYFFTALPEWNPDKTKRHKNYVEALNFYQITTIYWKFYEVSKVFRKKTNTILDLKLGNKHLNRIEKDYWIDKAILKKVKYTTYEEKRTDVNMALKIFEDAVNNHYDDAMIISWDSDIIPVITAVKRTIKDSKSFISVLPYKAKWKSIKKACNEKHEMRKEHVLNSIIPQEITLKDWTKIKCPYPY